jgi:hypothetical protein
MTSPLFLVGADSKGLNLFVSGLESTFVGDLVSGDSKWLAGKHDSYVGLP